MYILLSVIHLVCTQHGLNAAATLTEEHVAGKSRNARSQRHVVITEVAAIWIEMAVFDVQLAAVHGVDGPVVELVAFQLTGLVVSNLLTSQ